jgi:hypothetical protein
MNLRQRVGVFLGVLVIALTAGFVAATPASAAYTYWKIKLNGYDRCLDIRDVSYADGALAQTYSCIAGQPNQRFKLWPIPGTTNWYNIQADYNAKCLDVVGVSPFQGAHVQQYTCLGYGQLNQIWRRNVIGNNNGNVIVAWQSVNSPWCLAATNWDNGSDVIQDSCANTNRNYWEMIPN